MAAICLLPDLLISQIAAGEVIERPASVVKELLENAVDAGAQQIHLTLEDGGIRRIRVQDDGCGIPQVDLSLAVTRHATSKIQSMQDLQQIATHGFRGEALAAIGSVSQLTLTSRTQDAPHASQISNISGAWILGPTAAGVGTTVDIQALFHAVPARRRFLKTAGTEWGHAREAFVRQALIRADLGWQLTHQDRLVMRLMPCEPGRRIAQVLDLPEARLRIVDEVRGRCTLSLGCRPRPMSQADQISSTFLSMGEPFAIACSSRHCAWPMQTSCTETASQPRWSHSPLTQGSSM